MGAAPDRRKTGLWLVGAGVVAAGLAWGAGTLLERSRFGGSDEASVARMESELRNRFDLAANTLQTIARRVVDSRSLIQAAARDQPSVARLFDALEAALPAEPIRRTGITVYAHPGAVPLAWSGRASDLVRARIEGPAALFVAPRGRLIRVEPVVDPERSAIRLATIVVEQLLEDDRPALQSAAFDDTLIVRTAIAPATLRTVVAPVATSSPYNFLIPATSGQVLMEAEVHAKDLSAARRRWRTGTWAAVWSVLGVTLILACGVVLDIRRRVRTKQPVLISTLVILAILAAARAALGRAAAAFSAREPIDLLLTALFLSVGVWLLLDLVERRRLTKLRPALIRVTPGGLAQTAIVYFAAGAAGTGILWAYARSLRAFVTQSTLDLTHFSLHPLVAERLMLAFGLVLLHVAVMWSVVLILRLIAVEWRRVRAASLFAAATLGWAAGAAAAIAAARRTSEPVELVPLVGAVGASLVLAGALEQPRGRARRASQTARLFALYLALLVPAVAMYPSLHAFVTEARERLIAHEFGPQAASQREDLWRRRVPDALEQIDAMPMLAEFVGAPPGETAPAATRDRAFLVWSQTSLAQFRLTSSVELYGAKGNLVSSFALNLPEYSPTPYVGGNCDWDLYEEVPSLGTERHVLRASRSICDRGTTLGGIVLRVMFDYRDLPFVSVERRYLQSLGPEPRSDVEDDLGRGIEFAVYGWSRAPLYNSGTRVWPLPDEVFERTANNREPFWATVAHEGGEYRVYYLNDQIGIYALGYASVTWFGHLVNLAELVTQTFVLYILMLLAATAFSTFFSAAPASGRALLRELRSSFYRKLFLYFVLASVVPVGILALVTSTYFTAQLNARVEQAAVDTARVAQRLVEDYAALQERGAQSLESLDDQFMLLVGRAIDQDVDLFGGARLQATSERDLYASGILSERTPAEVFRQIAVERRPTFVGVEQMGGRPYQLAAAPVRAGLREGIVTVPQTLRRQEIERQIDDLNRQVVLGLVAFVLLGAAIGYWMAERIADPVNRLTRATRRIARGDLDARIAATSSDELRRLVEDFNRMAADLKRQRTELERTQRLEAWADMARQVAHDIKNPLTPIQLSAEHARRVNQDQGRPLSPALDDCIASILTQVKLLRQIAAEFSSFASSPKAQPAPTELQGLIDEVVGPYRAGLAERIAIDVQPPAASLPHVMIDRTLFARALTNIIENALHAMPGGGRLTIRASMANEASGSSVSQPPGSQPHAHPASSVVVQITDTGVGMDQEALGRIFEPYFSTKASGTGLGLTIAKRNIELIGGTIAVASERGSGTTVTMRLRVVA